MTVIALLIMATVYSTYQPVMALIGQTFGGSPASGSGHAVRQPVADTNGLVGWWRMDGNTNDSSGNGNSGTLTNFNNDSTDGWTSGKFGGGLKFDGVNDFVSLSNVSVSLPLTISFWANTASPSSYQKVISEEACNGPQVYLIGGVWKIDICGDSNSGAASSLAIQSGTWHFVTAVFSSTTSRTLYVDNQPPVTNTYSDSNTTLNLQQIGIENLSNPYNGTLDDVRIYNRALSASEISQLYVGSAPSNCDQTCVGYWKLNESGGHASNDGTLNNFNFTGSDGWVAGKFGNALEFDGTDDYVSKASAPLNVGTSMTVSFWVDPTTLTSGNYYTFLSYGGHIAGGFIVQESNSNTLRLAWGGTDYYDGPTFTTTGSWSHIVVTVSAGVPQYFYVNGVQTAATRTNGSGTFSITSPQTLEIGRRTDTASQYINGSLDDLRIYNRALSAAEVSRLYINGESAVLDSSLLGWWRFNETTGTTASDSSNFAADSTSNGNIGTLKSFTFDNTTNGWTSGVFGNGLLFNGTSDYIVVPSSSAFDFGTGDFSIELWLNATSTGNYQTIYSRDSNHTGSGILAFINPTGGTLHLWVGGTITDGTKNIANGAWNHLAIVRSSGTVSIFVNGVLDKSVSMPNTVNVGTNPLYLGITDLSYLKYLNGRIDDVRVYNRALQPYEIYDQYLAGR